MLEDEAILAALAAENEIDRDRALKQVIAIREERIERWDSVRLLDLPQEQIEGTAEFIGRRLGSMLGSDISNLENFAQAIGQVPEENVRVHYAWDRFYGTGSAIMFMVDQLGVQDWSRSIESGKSPYGLLVAHFNLSEDEQRASFEGAKETYQFKVLENKAIAVAEMAATESTDIWAQHGFEDISEEPEFSLIDDIRFFFFGE